jgi:hypothetical protein
VVSSTSQTQRCALLSSPRGRIGPGSLLLGIALCLLAILPAAASAELQTIDFETGPPALGSPLDGVGDISFPRALGFRPYRTSVGARAHSGTTVGDLGRCLLEEAEAGGCENFQAQTTAQLTRTAERVTVFAGRFGPVDPSAEPELATLIAFGADGTALAASGPVPIDDSGFGTELSVVRPAGDIASFRIEATSGDLGIDDLKVNFAGAAKPDFSISATNQVVAVLQGQRADVPIALSRVNGSSGPVQFSVAGLPPGVSASVSPNPVPGGQTTANLRLTAAASAPDTNFVPTDVRISADPLGNTDVAPAPRTTTVSVRVATSFGLGIGAYSNELLPPLGAIPIEAPDCAPVDLPLKISRDIAFNQSLALSLRENAAAATGLPAGVSAEILPDATVAPGGGLSAERTLRFRADPGANLSQHRLPIVLTAKAGTGTGSFQKTLPLSMTRATPSATVAPSTPAPPLGTTPRSGRPGSRVRIHGSGFCPGTSVEVGNEYATAPATLVDEHTLEFTVPRYATSGPVTVDPPGSLASYTTANSLGVDSVRNSDAFQFRNYAFGDLSFSELARAFGTDDVYLSVNPCWPFGSCRVSTGLIDPIAAIEWKVIDHSLGASGGHCLGMSLAVQELLSGRESYRQFATPGSPPPSHAFELAGPQGPSANLSSFLDAEHAKQESDEFLTAWYRRDRGIPAQLATLGRELGRNREPMVTLERGDRSHVVLAYDMAQTADGADIYVYDSEGPFRPAENADGTEHRRQVDLSTIHVDKLAHTWSDPAYEWARGGDDGSLWVTPTDAIPADPSLPGLGALKAAVESIAFGSGGGSVATPKVSAGAEFLPTFSSAGAPGGGGTWVAPAGGDPLEVSFEGVKDGEYTQAYTAPGFVAGLSHVRTGEGVRDTVRGEGDSVSIESGESRPLAIELAKREGATATQAATVDTHASTAGSDSAGFADGGTLTYTHDGAPTTLDFTLTSIHTEGGPATFASGPVTIGDGERLSAKPLDRDLSRVRLRIRDAHGKTRTRVLRNRVRAAGLLKLGAVKVSGRRLSVPLRLSGIHGRAIVGASLRLVRGKRVVARKVLSLRSAGGTRRIAWRLPHAVKSGAYRLLTDVRALPLADHGTASGSVRAHRGASVTLRR